MDALPGFVTVWASEARPYKMSWSAGRLAVLAHGSCIVRYDKTMVLSTAVVDPTPLADADGTQLQVGAEHGTKREPGTEAAAARGEAARPLQASPPPHATRGARARGSAAHPAPATRPFAGKGLPTCPGNPPGPPPAPSPPGRAG
jgi:hypothetical protein